VRPEAGVVRIVRHLEIRRFAKYVPRGKHERQATIRIAILSILAGSFLQRPSSADDDVGPFDDLAREALSTIDGRLEIVGLRQPVEILRNEFGVPHVYAANLHDLFFAQGFVIAQDRLRQLEMTRYVAQGRVSELIGEAGLSHDSALLVLGITPGPTMLQQRPDVFWAVVASMYVGNIFLLVLNLPLIPYMVRVLETPRPLLISLIVIFCLVGVYGLSFSSFDLILLVAFGLVGFGMRRFGFPTAPLILAMILGALMEENMRRALQISSGDWGVFLEKPIALIFLILAGLSLLMPLFRYGLRRFRTMP
jgi:hypothetical protein